MKLLQILSLTYTISLVCATPIPPRNRIPPTNELSHGNAPSSNRLPSTSNNLHAALAPISSSTNNLDAEVGNLKVHLANLIWRDRYGADNYNHPPSEGKEYNEAMKSVMDEVMRLTTDVVFQKHQRAEGMMMSESEKLKAQRIALGKIIDEATKVRSLKEDIVNLLWHNRYGARGQRQPKGKKYEEAMKDIMEEVSRLTLNAIYQKHRETEVVTMLAFERLEAERVALEEIRDKWDGYGNLPEMVYPHTKDQIETEMMPLWGAFGDISYKLN